MQTQTKHVVSNCRLILWLGSSPDPRGLGRSEDMQTQETHVLSDCRLNLGLGSFESMRANTNFV